MINKVLIEEYLNRFPGKNLVLFRALLYYYRDPNFRVITLARYCLNGKNEYFRKKFSKKLLIKYGVTISNTCKIGKNFYTEHYNGIVIGRDVVIGDNCLIYQQVTIGQKDNKYPVIGNNVTIYAGAKIIGDIHIGDNVVVGANSVVLESIPDNCIVAGVPAKIIRKECD